MCNLYLKDLLVRSFVLNHYKMNTILKRSFCTNTKAILVEKGPITTIGINRPEKRNCVNRATAKLLKEAIQDFENDNTSKVGVLYGVGGNFCAGFDLEELSNFDRNDTESFFSKTGHMGPTLRMIKKPLIAAISGYAVAGGLELALMCDLRVMEETAVLGVYSRRFGVPLIDGGTVRLQAIVGLSRALDLILTGRSLDAKEAFEWGIANRFVACGTALGQAIHLGSSLIKFPQECLLADRMSTYNAAYNQSYDKLLEYEQVHGCPIVAKESIEGAKKFVDGVGRHGKTYNLKEKPKMEWEKEYEKISPVDDNLEHINSKL